MTARDPELDPERLARFLLGELPRDDEAALVARMLTDAAVWQAVQLAEDDLIDAHALDRLGGVRRARGGARIARSPRLQERLAFARDLHALARGRARSEIVCAHEAFKPPMTEHERLYARHDELVRELASLETRLIHEAELAATRVRLKAELARVKGDLAERAAKLEPVRLPTIRVTRPCPVSWDEMKGDAQVRHCQRCDKPVFNLSEMTQGEAEAVLAAHTTRPCVRFYRRADGTVKTADCETPRRWGVAIAAGALAASVAAAGAALTMAPTPIAVESRTTTPPQRPPVAPLERVALPEPPTVPLATVALPPPPAPPAPRHAPAPKPEPKPELWQGDVDFSE